MPDIAPPPKHSWVGKRMAAKLTQPAEQASTPVEQVLALIAKCREIVQNDPDINEDIYEVLSQELSNFEEIATGVLAFRVNVFDPEVRASMQKARQFCSEVIDALKQKDS